MALHHETEIYKAVVDLQRLVMRAAVNMRRDVKPLLGARLLDESLWMSVLVRRANIALNAAKVPHLDDLLEQLEIVQVTFRLARDLDYLPNNVFAQSLPLTASVGKQATAWKNSYAPTPSPVA
jgi:hypothetical protein